MRKKNFRLLLQIGFVGLIALIIHYNKTSYSPASSTSGNDFVRGTDGSNNSAINNSSFIPNGDESSLDESNFSPLAGPVEINNSSSSSHSSVFKEHKYITDNTTSENASVNYTTGSSNGNSVNITTSPVIALNVYTVPQNLKKDKNTKEEEDKNKVAKKSIFSSAGFSSGPSEIYAPPTTPGGETEVPLDDYYYVIIILCAVFSFYKINQFKKLKIVS